jgi:hypothetical protein
MSPPGRSADWVAAQGRRCLRVRIASFTSGEAAPVAYHPAAADEAGRPPYIRPGSRPPASQLSGGVRLSTQHRHSRTNGLTSLAALGA